jgi:hypothetical protein
MCFSAGHGVTFSKNLDKNTSKHNKSQTQKQESIQSEEPLKGGAGTAYPTGSPEFTPDFSGVRATRSFALYVCFGVRRLYFWLLCCLFLPINNTDADLAASYASLILS